MAALEKAERFVYYLWQFFSAWRLTTRKTAFSGDRLLIRRSLVRAQVGEPNTTRPAEMRALFFPAPLFFTGYLQATFMEAQATRHRLPVDALAAIPDSIERWLSPRQVAEVTGLSEKWLEAAREGRKKLDGPPFIKIGKGRSAPIRYPLHSLTEWMRSFEAVLDNAGRKESTCSSYAEFQRSTSTDAAWLFALDLKVFSYQDFMTAIKSDDWSNKLRLRWLTRADFDSGAVFVTAEQLAADKENQPG